MNCLYVELQKLVALTLAWTFFHYRPSETDNETKVLYRMPKSEMSENIKSSSSNQVLRPFFDDWPRSLQESENLGTSLSISVPGNQSSDVSLKLSTGGARGNPGPEGIDRREQPHYNGATQIKWEDHWLKHLGHQPPRPRVRLIIDQIFKCTFLFG